MDEIVQQPNADYEVAKYLMDSGAYTVPEEKYNVHLFLHRVATAEDTTKVGNLTDLEVGVPKYPVRSLQEFSLISSDIIENKTYSDYFRKWAEIILATSLSREGFLVKQATTTTRQIADITKKRKHNKGWFGFRKKDEEDRKKDEEEEKEQ